MKKVRANEKKTFSFYKSSKNSNCVLKTQKWLECYEIFFSLKNDHTSRPHTIRKGPFTHHAKKKKKNMCSIWLNIAAGKLYWQCQPKKLRTALYHMSLACEKVVQNASPHKNRGYSSKHKVTYIRLSDFFGFVSMKIILPTANT